MELDKLLDVSTLAGKIMLENGAETYRVEETIVRICLAFGAEYADSFVIPSSIIVSITYDDEVSTLVKRITSNGVDLNKIDKVNDLARNITTKNITIYEFKKQLIEISRLPKYTEKTILIGSALAASCYAVMFGGTLKDFFSALIMGTFIKILAVSCKKLSINDFFINSLGGATCALLGILCIKLNICDNLDKSIIGSIMLLVPGLTITNAIRDTIAGDVLSGITKAAEAILVAISIAVGTGAVLSIFINNI